LRNEHPNTSLGSLPRRQVITTFIGVLLAIFLSSLDQTIVSTAMPEILADLGGFQHYTFVTTAYLVTSTTMIPITGKLTDILGRKWFYTAGIIIFIIGSILSGLSQTLNQLIFFRAFQGIGGGIMIANAFAVIGDLFTPAERGKYQGYISGVFGLSSIIGPTLGGFITDTISWHWIFYINVPLGIGVIILFIFFFPNLHPERKGRRIDYPGIALLLLAAIPLLLALSWGGVEYPWVSVPIISMLVFSLVMAGGLYLVETRSPEPILPLQFFTHRIISISLAVSFLTGFGMFGAIIFIPLFFQGVLGFSATSSGSFLTPMMLGLVTGSLASGQLLSRAGGHYKIQGIIGISLMAVGMGLLATINPETGYIRAVIYIILTGLGLGVTFPLYTVVAQNAVPYNFLGSITSMVPFSRFMGGTLGLAILGSILSNAFARQFINELPAALKNMLPPDRLSALAHNPQALVSPQAQEQLKEILAQFGQQSDILFNQVIQALREGLSSALSEVFFIAFIVVIIALIVHLFIKEIPLRRQH
jgi:EmrB/QacA subfamily drug resistance transporter